MIDDKFAEQMESLGREYPESEARFLNTLQAKFDAMNTGIHNLTKRVLELETEAKEVNILKQQVCELDDQLAANCNAQEVADIACNLRWHGVPQVEGETPF